MLGTLVVCQEVEIHTASRAKGSCKTATIIFVADVFFLALECAFFSTFITEDRNLQIIKLGRIIAVVVETSFLVILQLCLATVFKIEAAAITEPDESRLMIYHVLKNLIRFPLRKINVANRALKIFPEILYLLQFIIIMMLLQMAPPLILTHENPCLVTAHRAKSSRADLLNVFFVMFSGLFNFIHWKRNIAEIAILHSLKDFISELLILI
jgi:hypothetical protein